MAKKLGWVLFFIVIAIGGTIGKNVGKELFDKWNAPTPPTREEIQAKIADAFKTAAEQANQRGPVMVDEDTRMDRVEAGPGPHVTYFYSLPRMSTAAVRPSDVAVGIRKDVAAKSCSNEKTRPLLNAGAVFSYVFRSSDGTEIGRFDLTADDCGAA